MENCEESLYEQNLNSFKNYVTWKKAKSTKSKTPIANEGIILDDFYIFETSNILFVKMVPNLKKSPNFEINVDWINGPSIHKFKYYLSIRMRK